MFVGSIIFMVLAGIAALGAATIGIKKPGKMLALCATSVLLIVATVQMQHQLFLLKPVLFDLVTYPGPISFLDIIIGTFFGLLVYEKISERRDKRTNPST